MVESQSNEESKSILERRNRNGLKVDTATIQKGWEQKQVLKALAVHGPFKPLLLTKERMRSLSTSDKNKSNKDFENDEGEIDQQSHKVQRRRSGFWRLVNGCFGGGQPKRHPTKPLSPKKTHVNQVEQNLPIVSPQHQNSLKKDCNQKESLDSSMVKEKLEFKSSNEKYGSEQQLSAVPASDKEIMENDALVKAAFPKLHSLFYDSDWEKRLDALFQLQDIVDGMVEDEEKNASDALAGDEDHNIKKKLDTFFAACDAVNYFLSGKEHIMKIMILSYDVFLSVIESLSTVLQRFPNHRFIREFHEDNKSIADVVNTLVRRIGENNKKIFKNSAKTLIFVGRQKTLRGSKLVANAFTSAIPNIETNQRAAILSLRARIQLCTKSFVKEFGFNTEVFEDGFDQEKMIKNIILPAFLCSDSKSYTYAISLCVKSYEILGKSFYKKLKAMDVPRKSLDEIKTAIKENKNQSKSASKESQNANNLERLTPKKCDEDINDTDERGTVASPEVTSSPTNSPEPEENAAKVVGQKDKKRKKKKKKTKTLSKSKSKANLLSIEKTEEPAALKPLERSLHPQNSLQLKPLKSLKPLVKGNKLSSKYVLRSGSENIASGNPFQENDPFQKKKILA